MVSFAHVVKKASRQHLIFVGQRLPGLDQSISYDYFSIRSKVINDPIVKAMAESEAKVAKILGKRKA